VFAIANSKWVNLGGILVILAMCAALVLAGVLNTGIPLAIVAALWLAFFAIFALVPHPGPLKVGPAGLTMRSPRKPIHVPWQDIKAVGVIKRSVNDGSANHIVVIRLTSEHAVLKRDRLLSDDLHRLGYFGLMRLGQLKASREQVLMAFDRFSGGRVTHSDREFFER